MRLRTTLASLTVGLTIMAATTVSAGPQARVIGTVTTSAGAPVPDAVITITCEALPTFTKVIDVEDDGSYKVLLLDATQAYQFRVEAPGFLTAEDAVKVPVGTMDNERSFTLTTQAEAAKAQQVSAMEQPGYRQIEAGVQLEKAGDVEAARLRYREATELRPELAVAWEALVKADFKLGDHAAVLEHARRCLELDDESLACLAAAVNSARALGDEVAHAAYLTRYTELNPEDPATLFNEAAAKLNAYDDEGAKPLLERCLEIDSANPSCLYEYGMLLLRGGDMEKAKSHFERYLEAAPEGPEAATVRETLKYL